MPPLVLTIIGLINAATTAAPKVAAIYTHAREVFQRLFAGGLITKEQQNMLRTWADEHERATLAGEIPPGLKIDPDPA